MLNRRQLLGKVPALAGLPLLSGLFGLPTQALAASASQRKFLFVFAGGGWDPTWVFAPMFDSPYVDSDPDATVAERGDFATWTPLHVLRCGLFLSAMRRPAAY